MVTKEQALAASMFHHISATNADGTPQRFRANGKCKTWKTRPDDFRVPVKRGMYTFGYITPQNAALFNVAS